MAWQIYNKEGIGWLRDKPKSGKRPHLSSEIFNKIGEKLTESKQDWLQKRFIILYYITLESNTLYSHL